MYTIISFLNIDTLMSSFPICIALISFGCLIPLATILTTILNRQGESGQPCLVPDFSWIASSFSPFNLMLAIGLLHIVFIMFRYVSGIPDLAKTFNMEGCTLSKAFSEVTIREPSRD